MLLQEFPTAFFGFIWARTFDPFGEVFEPIERTQRFRIWAEIAKIKIGKATFSHLEFPDASGYLLPNKNTGFSMDDKVELMKGMSIATYSDFPDLIVW